MKPVNEKPSKNEDEYFARRDAELMKEMRAKLDEERRKAERSSHFMKCPKCGADLKETDWENVKVDVCPDCHGVWLDQGEIDMLRHQTQAKPAGAMGGFFDLFHRTGTKK